MVGPKSTQIRLVGIITDEMHPYTFFTETLLLENKKGCILSVIIPTTLICVLFGPTIPTYSFNLFDCFLYSCTCTCIMPLLGVRV